MKTDPRTFILANTEQVSPPHVPEIQLYLATEAHDLWLKTEDELQEIGLPPPFWAFAWAGGQGLARYILDNPETVRGKSVVDFASGSGLVGIAAVKAGAARVLCADIDPWAKTAVALNASLNQVEMAFTPENLIGGARRADVYLAGDVFYDSAFASLLTPWFASLSAAGAVVLVGDPGRAYCPKDRLTELATYRVPVSRALEDNDVKRTTVWSFQSDLT